MAPPGAHLLSGAILYNSLGRALKPSGRRSRSRTKPLAPRAAGPAAPSTLEPARASQPSGIQSSAGFSQKPTASGAAAERRYTKWRRKAPYLPSEAVLYNSLSGALNLPVRRSRSQAEPLAPRAKGPAAPSTLAAKPRQPSGIQPSADSPSKAPRLKYRTQQKSTNLSTSASFLISSLFLPAIPAKTAQVP